MIYLHLLKNREGEVGIIKFENNLKYNRMDEYVDNSFSNNKNQQSIFS